MEVARLVLGYLEVLVSWPVAFVFVVAYFLKRHGQVVNTVFQRLSSVSLPGGVKLDLPYPSPPDPPLPAPVMPQKQAVLPPKGGEEDLECLKKDFAEFLWQGITVNRMNIGQEINRLWSQQGPAFFLDVQNTKAVSDLEMLQTITKGSRNSEKAVEDFRFLTGLKPDSSRKDLLAGYRKSNVLYGYLLHNRSV